MALTRFCFATSLLLLSLLVIASASDYGYGTSPEFDKSKSVEGEKPYPENRSDNGFATKEVFDKLKTEKKEEPYQEKSGDNGYGTNAVFDKLKSEEKENSYQEKSNDYGYGTSKSEEMENVNVEKSSENGYGPKPDLDMSKEKEMLLPIGVEGIVLCKSGTKYAPLPGAVARITCPAVHEQGYEAEPYSILSGETDAKGYFLATLCPSELVHKLKLTECKACLEKSPLETCKVPTDVNKGISGAHLSSYRLLNDMTMKLYSVGPFFYTSEPMSTPNGY